jgi:hypothetical protein
LPSHWSLLDIPGVHLNAMPRPSLQPEPLHSSLPPPLVFHAPWCPSSHWSVSTSFKNLDLEHLDPLPHLFLLPSLLSCAPGRLGRLCECSEAELSSLDLESGCRAPNGTGPLCSGKGRCQCGRCSCTGQSSGRLCECDDASCERHEGILCGGTWRVGSERPFDPGHLLALRASTKDSGWMCLAHLRWTGRMGLWWYVMANCVGGV